MARQRNSDHDRIAIASRPLAEGLMRREERGVVVRGNLVLDAHLAALLHQRGVKRFSSAGTDFRKFRFLEVVNPLAA